jgi:hypothetical protein
LEIKSFFTGSAGTMPAPERESANIIVGFRLNFLDCSRNLCRQDACAPDRKPFFEKVLHKIKRLKTVLTKQLSAE